MPNQTYRVYINKSSLNSLYNYLIYLLKITVTDKINIKSSRHKLRGHLGPPGSGKTTMIADLFGEGDLAFS